MRNELLQSIPKQKNKRWFVKIGATTYFDRGFKNSQEAKDWIFCCPHQEWRIGFAFKVYGLPDEIEIVNKKGNNPKY